MCNTVSYYIFISISIINIENKMYKYSSSKNHEPTKYISDLIYIHPSTVVEAQCMAGFLTRDTTN